MEQVTRDMLEMAMEQCIAITTKNASAFVNSYPGSASENLVYNATANDDWTEGFFTGMIWLAYEASGKESLKEAGLRQVRELKERLLDRIVVDHHDMGFLFSPSCVAAYQLVGDEVAKETALLAADNLMGRFQEKGQFFQAWGTVGDSKEYRLIIDCLLNMPLLFWASEVTGKTCYKEKATAHIETAMRHVVKADYATYHTYYFDPATGEPREGVTKQGNRNGSIWARGQAWGIYGAALSYGYLQNPAYKEMFKGLTKVFLSHLPPDGVPYWDFDFTDGSGEPRDSSASAIAVCGILEMLPYLEEAEAVWYREQALKLMTAVTKLCLVNEKDHSNGILKHGTYVRKSQWNEMENHGVNECTLWGDYFYMEALTRLRGEWKKYW